MNNHRFIYFDLGNVILFFDHQIACRNLAELCDREEEKIKQVIFDSELQQSYEDGQISTEEFHKEFCRELDVNIELSQVCFAASSIFTLNEEIIPVISRLRSTGIPLGILSNTCDAHWRYAIDGRYPILNSHFQIHALSFEMKCSKPNPQIYDLAAEMVSTQPQEIFFTDDRPENVQAAVDRGFDAVQFTTVKQLEADLISRDLLT